MPTTSSLSEHFERAMRDYPDARRADPFGIKSAFWPVVGALRRALQAAPAVAGSRTTSVSVSFGRGEWAEVPTLAVMDARATTSPTSGVYIVYLLAADGSSIFLSLNQGSADVMLAKGGDAARTLEQRAARIRPRLLTPAALDAGFSGAPPDLRSSRPLPKAYAAGAIIGKAYYRGSVPHDQELGTDLTVLSRIYRAGLPYCM